MGIKPRSRPDRGTSEVLSFRAADERLGGALSASFQKSYGSVVLFSDDLAVSGDFLAAVRKRAPEAFDLVAISGDLTVAGRIQLYGDTPGLYVAGSTIAQTLEGGDAEIYIQDGTFDYFVYGFYNHGILETGEVKTPWVINSDHDLRVSAGEGTRWIDNYGDDADYDFGSENIATSFVPEVLSDDGDEIEIDKLYQRLRAGKPVLVEGAKSGTESALAEVAGAREARQTELELPHKKLKAFPEQALAMPWLKKLVLDGNALGEVPGEIARLEQLEELSLVGCGLAELPEEIGALTNLRVLRIGDNKRWEWPGEHAVCVPIKIPDSIGDLVNLEVLDVSGLSDTVRGQEDSPLPDISVFELPGAASRLAKLRVLIARLTNLVLPRSMWGLSSLEELVLEGSSWCYLKEFPAYATSFPNLRKLDVSGNFFRTILDLSSLRELEELDLGNALGLVDRLPDLSGLSRLRVLNVSGNTDRSNVLPPKHDVLRPLFSMNLPALEDLRIDRWGKEEKAGRGDLTPDLIAGIGRFRALKRLDLEFDGLESLPADFYELTGLEDLKLGYNRLSDEELARIAAALPGAELHT